MTDPFDTVLEGLHDNANDRKYEAALTALASLQAAYEAMERERDHHEKRADNAFVLAKMSEERLEAADRDRRVNLQNAEANWERCMDAERERNEWIALEGEANERAKTAERERDTALEAMKGWNEQARVWERKSFDAHKKWRKDAIALDAAERERDELREAIASALTSLATGPAKDGYAYAVLFTASGKAKP